MILLAAAWDSFLQLPELHQWDRIEFMHSIHVAQNIVMARNAAAELAAIKLDPPIEDLDGREDGRKDQSSAIQPLSADGNLASH